MAISERNCRTGPAGRRAREGTRFHRPTSGLILCLLAGPTASDAQPCISDTERLCLRSQRFEVRVDWTDFEGSSGRGQAVPLTPETGYFWFFEASNVELLIKVLDGRALTGHFWVFFAALTNVEYTVTVTDTVGGPSRSYSNPLGNVLSVLDIEAIPGEPVGTPIFHCALDQSCPEILIDGDPPATLAGSPSPFRGYGDPSLESEPTTGTLWMSYSWLDLLVADPGPPAVVDLGVRTHLARSDDRGATFQLVRAINRTQLVPHPDSAVPGWTTHEVSTLVYEPPGGWQVLWLEYFNPVGPAERQDFLYSRSVAASPEQLGEASERWIRGSSTSASFGVRHNLSLIPELSDCAAFTEPGLFRIDGVTYLATGCVVLVGGVRREDRERVVLLRQQASGLTYLGELLNAADAERLGADRLEQADLTLSRDGSILLLVTPIHTGEDPEHQGCIAYEVSDLATAAVARDAAGAAIPRAILTADGNGLGPGLCTYDPESDTGILLVITTTDTASVPIDIEFSLRATGIHP